ncbi:MAG: (2Fe-2S)-binding protein [Alphaproteobacteria bacterium]|nr:(2Fe-2S)-binding protein [Alphaproteobacteria bacterium]
MYVCICNAVCSDRVSAAIDSGHHDPESVYAACGVRPNCGMCAETIEEMIWSRKASVTPVPAE